MSTDYLLYESSVGYAIFKVRMQADSVGSRLKEVQENMQDLAKFGKMVELVSFLPWTSAEASIGNQNDISEGAISEQLHTLLEANLPKPSKKRKSTLGVSDRVLAGNIMKAFPGVECETSETSDTVADMLRGIRLHAEKLLKQLQDGDVGRAQLHLGHSYSRAKVKFNVNRNDNHIIQAIATLDHLEKAVNQFSMRVREWYGWHFPELVRIVSDNHKYCKLAFYIGNKQDLTEDRKHELAAIVDDDEGLAQAIINAAKVSMGANMSEIDMESFLKFAKRAVGLTEYRKRLSAYLVAKMGVVAPNLATLIGETVGARLISHAGSLTNLAKYPASTVQILGAEKALFRALKTKGNTPKYGLIYHSSFIGRAGMKNKGRISRFLANKCSIASRIDNFSEAPSTRFGEALKRQVEERLEFYASGAVPMKNVDAMKSAMDQVLGDINIDTDEKTLPLDPGSVAGHITNDSIAEEKRAKKLEKAERKLQKKLKKMAKEGIDADGDITMEPTPGKVKLDQPEEKKKRKGDGEDAEKKKRKKHKHGKE